MPLLDKRIEVDAPAMAVFEFLGHVERLPRWWPGQVRAARVHERTGQGTVVHHETEACGTRLSWDARFEEWVPGKRLAWKQVSGDWLRHEGTWDLKAAGPGRTIVRLRAHVELPVMLEREVTEAEAAHELSRDLDMALLNLKDAVEA